MLVQPAPYTLIFRLFSPASFSPVVTIERWDINLAGDRKQPPGSPLQLYVQSRLPQAGAIFPPTVAQKSPGTMSHHDRNGEREESPELVSIAGLAFVQKVYLSWQAWFYGSSPAPATLAAGMGGAGGGDGDDGDDDSHIEKCGQEPQPEFFARIPASLVQLCLKQKQRLLTILHTGKCSGHRPVATETLSVYCATESCSSKLTGTSFSSKHHIQPHHSRHGLRNGCQGTARKYSCMVRSSMMEAVKHPGILFPGKRGSTGNRLRWQWHFGGWHNVKTGWANRNDRTEKWRSFSSPDACCFGSQ